MGWRCTRRPGHDGPCAALPTGTHTIVVSLEGNEPLGLLAVTRWLKDGLHLLLNDGPTRRAVDKLYAALEADRCGRRDPTGRTLEAHHVRDGYDVDDGITVCGRNAPTNCHRAIDRHAR